jgi:hypothetical protein
MLRAREVGRNIELSGTLADFEEITGELEATIPQMVEAIKSIWDLEDVDWSTQGITVVATPEQWTENVGEPEPGASSLEALHTMKDAWGVDMSTRWRSTV